MKKDGLICLGAFAGAHGVHGDVRVKSFTEDPKDIAAYGELTTQDRTRTFTLRVKRILKGDFVLAAAPEITSREDAEALKGTKLFVVRAHFPEPDDDEFYVEDLVGLRAVDENGAQLGLVKAVHNFGGGDIIELSLETDESSAVMIAFTKANVPEIDMKQRSLTIANDAFLSN